MGKYKGFIDEYYGTHDKATIKDRNIIVRKELILLTGVYAILKIVGIIDWSWWWVFSPIWVILGIALAGLVAYFMVLAIVYIILKIQYYISKCKQMKF